MPSFVGATLEIYSKVKSKTGTISDILLFFIIQSEQIRLNVQIFIYDLECFVNCKLNRRLHHSLHPQKSKTECFWLVVSGF